ncbi:MAG: hypothetical protein KME35_16860 [Aphanocapsa sp. GSE-SYN-MK-11-07L]|nr:hypothetical protein [Aphanocapsa sp. GSE-SYN-MK-11-07L]
MLYISVEETEIWLSGQPFRRLYLGFDPLQVLHDLSPTQAATDFTQSRAISAGIEPIIGNLC